MEAVSDTILKYHPSFGDTWAGVIGGAAAGFFGLVFVVPTDLLKCRAQMTKTGNLDVWREIKIILKSKGLFGLYLGFWAAALRDVPALAMNFGAYELLKDVVTSDDPLIQSILTINAAGMAGSLSWVVSIPQDFVKNKIQT